MIWDFVKRKILRLSRDRWNYQYSRGQWTGLHSERNRFEAVRVMMQDIHPNPAILEIGCGDAILFQQLSPHAYAIFEGVDIADVAIRAAKRFERPGVTFTNGDMTTYLPSRSYDLIIFNESLYYAKNPAATLKRYLPYLAAGGTFIVTAVRNKYTAGFWPGLFEAFKVLREAVVDADHHWDVRQMVAK